MGPVIDRKLYIRKMHAILNELRISYSKEFLLSGYGVEHTTDLSDAQLEELVKCLEAMKTERNREYQDKARKMRSEVLCLLNKYGIYNTNNDWTEVNNFLLQPRIAGKKLYELNLEELKALRAKLNSILSKQAKVKAAEQQTAKLN